MVWTRQESWWCLECKISVLLVSKTLGHGLKPDRKGHGVVLETVPPSTVRRKRL